jgi:hypothetical protein
MEIIEWLFMAAIRVGGFIFGVYFLYWIYFGKDRPNIPDEDLDRVSKGGPDPH